MPLIQADARAIPLADESVNCVVTSPPYWGLRDYGVPGQIGLERTPDEFVATMVQVFREVWRVLRKDGTCWVNLGDSYTSTAQGTFNSPERIAGGAGRESPGNLARARYRPFTGLKPKDLCMIPARVAIALQADGWYLRSDIIWAKPNPMPESVTDRPTKAHEYVFLLSKAERYWYDADAVREPGDTRNWRGSPTTRRGNNRMDSKLWERRGDVSCDSRNLRSVWTIPTQPYSGAHFATFPEPLAERCILAGCPAGGRVLDPFVGSGTVVQVARRHGRIGIGLDLSWTYLHDHAMARGDGRTSEKAIAELPMFAELK